MFLPLLGLLFVYTQGLILPAEINFCGGTIGATDCITFPSSSSSRSSQSSKKSSSAPSSLDTVFAQQEVSFSTIYRMLNKIDWYPCTRMHILNQYENLSTVRSFTRGFVFAIVARKLCLPLGVGAPVSYSDFEDHMQFASEIRILSNLGFRMSSFDSNGNSTGLLEADKPMNFLEVMTLFKDLLNHGMRWVPSND